MISCNGAIVLIGFGTGWLLRPAQRAPQRRHPAFTVLLEAHLERAHGCPCVNNSVDRKPAGQFVAASTIATPAEAAAHGVVERPAYEIAIIASLERNRPEHRNKGSVVASNSHVDLCAIGCHSDRCWRRVKSKCALTDVVARITRQQHKISSARYKRRVWFPQVRGYRKNGTRRSCPIVGTPVNHSPQRRATSFAVLLEVYVDGLEDVVRKPDAVDRERASQRIAASTLA